MHAQVVSRHHSRMEGEEGYYHMLKGGYGMTSHDIIIIIIVLDVLIDHARPVEGSMPNSDVKLPIE